MLKNLQKFTNVTIDNFVTCQISKKFNNVSIEKFID